MTPLVEPMQSAAPLDLWGWPADNTPVSRFLAAIQRGSDEAPPAGAEPA
jgi:hypothetical protein